MDNLSLQAELAQIEKELNFEELRILRQVVFDQLEKRMQNGEVRKESSDE